MQKPSRRLCACGRVLLCLINKSELDIVYLQSALRKINTH